MATGAVWLSKLEEGKFPLHDETQLFTPRGIPLPNAELRRTVSRPDLPGFYFIGESWAKAVYDILSAHPDKSPLVLDIGCGCGKLARFLMHNPNLRYVGFDIFAPAIEWCRKAFAPLSDRFTFVHFDGISAFYNPKGSIPVKEFEFPVEDRSVTVATAASLFTHLLERDCRAYMQKLSKKLAHDGRALISIAEATEGKYVGTEASIRVDKQYFIEIAESEGLRLVEEYGLIGGQYGLIFGVRDGA